ncbi:MAG: glycoside hydrolase family 15 protein [Acidocella sp.]|nr:glycoside hydrolase family 15 protein [Acidocella sp.]
MTEAPGSPGIAPRWTSSAKDGVGTALSPRSAVWFTHSHGILNEIYYPAVDAACTRDCGFIVTDGQPGGFFAEEKRDTTTSISRLADGVPLFLITNTCKAGRFVIEKRIMADPAHDCVLQDIRLIPAPGVTGLRLFVLLAPHLVNGGAHNSGWLGAYKGVGMLLASGDSTSLALACAYGNGADGFLSRSVGFVGVSDGWQMLRRYGHLATAYDTATDGNIALAGELDAARPARLAIGFGRTPQAACFQAAASLASAPAPAMAAYAADWQRWQSGLEPLDPKIRDTPHNLYRVSTTVLRSHESPLFPGGSIASLSIPWGDAKGDDDLGGYHLVWPRDLAETGGALLACGATEDARRVLDYLRVIQEPDGHWRQNTWLDGSMYWGGIQMDETAFPILLLDLAWRHGAVAEAELGSYWPMVRAACGFILRNGPASDQDRWEENAGYTPATIAVEIAGLLAAADLALRMNEPAMAAYLQDTADAWNTDIESWMYVSGTALAETCEVRGYYLRVVAEGGHDLAAAPVHGRVAVRNRPADATDIAADALVGPDALALVRFGLRAADDPRILDTVKVIDHLTRVELPQGPGWHRYNDDGYGEHHDGRAFDGTGYGRVWPLLAGERAHFEIAAGNFGAAAALQKTIEACASEGGLLPEQVWDAEDIPARGLYLGRPSGSAMPLVWAHGEYIKLLRSLRDEAIFDLPPQTVQRYLKDKTVPRCRDWREDWRRSRIPVGQDLRVQFVAQVMVRFSLDDWASFQDIQATDTGFGVFAATLSAGHLPTGGKIIFTWQNPGGDWHGENVVVAIGPA